MALVGPPPMLGSNPFAIMLDDVRSERSGSFPPGETRFSIARTRRFANEPLPMLLEAYERYGPIFTMRLFHSNVVWMLGPEANH
ncbi:MAG: cytochrome, partial [Solirubrobacterales bacterium]|nr:cytochrome [Solirubrobacterales bacterium]